MHCTYVGLQYAARQYDSVQPGRAQWPDDCQDITENTGIGPLQLPVIFAAILSANISK